MMATLVWIAAATLAAGPADGGRIAILVPGGNPATGHLRNLTPGYGPLDPPDPTRPTLVAVHGLNPAPRTSHFVIGEAFRDAFRVRGGRPWNVLTWEWNAATLVSATPAVNHEAAVEQGRRLASALRDWGVDPSLTHLVGQSSGTLVIASAAAEFRRAGGPLIARVTLLDPATTYHERIFGTLGVGTSAGVVENDYAPGISGYGAYANAPGVRNLRVEPPRPWLGVVDPVYAHWHVLRWYIRTVADPTQAAGFNIDVVGGA